MEFIFENSKPLKVPSFGQLIKISINRKNWDSQTPHQKWCFLYGIGKACISKTGFTVFEHDQKLKWYSYLAIPFLSMHLFLATYTIIHYIAKGESIKCLPSTSMLGLAISVSFLLLFHFAT